MQINTKDYISNYIVLDDKVDLICKMRANNYTLDQIKNKCNISKRKLISILQNNTNIINYYIIELQNELTNELIKGKSCNDLSNEYNISKAKIINLIKEKIGEDEFNKIYRSNKNKKISKTLTLEPYNKICERCGSNFLTKNKNKKCCSIKCARSLVGIKSGLAGGRASAKAQSETRRSKNEKLFCEMCKNYFNNVIHNEPIFNGWDADVIIEDIKYAVLWNGRWHYEQCNAKHSVKQVQNRDRIKIKEIIKCGYIPYVIKDMGKHNPDFVKLKFDEFINQLNANKSQ